MPKGINWAINLFHFDSKTEALTKEVEKVGEEDIRCEWIRRVVGAYLWASIFWADLLWNGTYSDTYISSWWTGPMRVSLGMPHFNTHQYSAVVVILGGWWVVLKAWVTFRKAKIHSLYYSFTNCPNNMSWSATIHHTTQPILFPGGTKRWKLVSVVATLPLLLQPQPLWRWLLWLWLLGGCRKLWARVCCTPSFVLYRILNFVWVDYFNFHRGNYYFLFLHHPWRILR